MSGWFSIQVKTGAENVKTGRVIRDHRSKRVELHVLAIVGLRGGKVRYLPNAKELPEELRAIQ
jgi:hypothetical protein